MNNLVLTETNMSPFPTCELVSRKIPQMDNDDDDEMIYDDDDDDDDDENDSRENYY